jgi:two-component system response regulator AlgR
MNTPALNAALAIFLVDDEAPARARMRDVLGDIAAELPNRVVGEAATGAEALAAVPGSGAQVVLVDIHMPQMSGMELARHLARLERGPAVIFVTAHDQYAVDAFEVNALDYLLKPVRAARLAAALRKAQARGAPEREALERAAEGQGPRRFLSVSERGRILLVALDQVLFMRAEQKYVTLRTRERDYLVEESLTALEQEFGERFVRIHRSVLVARDAVRGCERAVDEDGEGAGWAMILDGCTERLPVSRRLWPTVRTLVKG